ncbi:putative methyltransferase-domain-containing protein [Pisolithus croceorrhizus]|nr:putative methyltransferase-domain-containing protein [Pisolithus croceorrhizus]
MLALKADDDPEDILSSSLQTLYDFAPITHSTPGSIFTYIIKPTLLPNPNSAKVIELETPDPQPSKWDLHASSIWVAAVYLADHAKELELHRYQDRETFRVLELGAGAGLPSILIARAYPNVDVTISDYPDEQLIQTLSENISRNGVSGIARAVPYDWGTDISRLVGLHGSQETLENDVLFDVVIAADTLWNPALHQQFIQSLVMSLKRSPDSRVYLVAGLHTGRYTIQAFLRSIETDGSGLVVESLLERQVTAAQTSRSWDVARAENEDEQERRRWVVWMVLKWREHNPTWGNEVIVQGP